MKTKDHDSVDIIICTYYNGNDCSCLYVSVYTYNVSIYSFNQFQYYLTAYDFPRRYKISVVMFVSITFQASPPRNHGCLEARLPLGFRAMCEITRSTTRSLQSWLWNPQTFESVTLFYGPAFLQCFVMFFDSLCLFILITFSCG